MSRDDGFEIADVATGLFDDPKVRNLWRALGDQDRMSRALALYLATLLASWRQGCRVTIAEAVPLWLVPDPELVAALKDARLLDRSGRIPASSWRGWFDPAAARRQVLRDRWNRANAKRKEGDRAVTARLPRGNSAATATPVPSVPSDRTVSPRAPAQRRARARGDAPSNGADGERRPGSLRDALTAMGLALPAPVEPMPANADASADAPGESWFEPAAKAGGAE